MKTVPSRDRACPALIWDLAKASPKKESGISPSSGTAGEY